MALADNTGCAKPSEEFPFPEIIELNVGGQVYITRHPTLVSVPGSLLWEMFTQKNVRSLARDSKGRFFVDRDGFLFRYILDYMRDQQLVLPDHFPERSRLQREAEYFMLPELVKMLAPKLSKQNSLGDDPCQSDPEELSPNADATRNLTSASATLPSAVAGGPGGTVTTGTGAASTDVRRAGFITIGYRGSYTLGRDSQTDAKFRRVARIMVCGKTSLAKEVFGDTLNESRDPDRPPERYTSRYYLKFTFLEQAFDKLADAGFHMVACNSTGTCAFAHDQTDDRIWTSYTEYVFYRPVVRGQLSRQLSRHCSLPGSSWLSLPIPQPSETEHSPKKHMSSSEPILDLKTDTAEALPAHGDPQEPKQSHETRQDPATAGGGDDFATSGTSSRDEPSPAPATDETLPGRDPQSEARDPSPTDSLPWPEAPEECPARPNTLDFSKSLKKLEEVKQTGQRRNSDHATVKENGVEVSPAATATAAAAVSEERRALESELGKCIEEFRKIKIPVAFPNKKRQWQSELLKKYQL
ncbi:LOW QUALITY PROTEIN: BTB/POZ domain-containing protein KCTD12-like [Harpia harpyja]|uniref:LOW QUALITY PROTEIN: BTB/POZ domain-containing protein KCTD12-like n=1 Tax=Harpia harpyja TaxID=202280 RepID=UPI0022B140F2|nr:LOW QUALITY PROTEIN: BTB/POZ domain-containing protein KCTD12-like [Harpia harpyja]